jgi:hypothetical protein
MSCRRFSVLGVRCRVLGASARIPDGKIWGGWRWRRPLQVEWALKPGDYDVQGLQVYKFNKPGRQFVKWSQPKLDPRLSYLVENTAEVLHKNITVRDRTVRAAAEQHVCTPILLHLTTPLCFSASFFVVR